jgi:hypothetical protein
MLSRLRTRLTYANVTATLALFVALGATSAYAINEWTGANIVDESLTGADVRGSDGTDTTRAVNGSLTSADIAGQPANSGTGQPYVNGSLTTWDLADNSLMSRDVHDDSLKGVDIKDGSVAGNDMQRDSVTGSEIAPDAIDQSELADGAVGASEVASNAIDSENIIDGSIRQEDLAGQALSEAFGTFRDAEMTVDSTGSGTPPWITVLTLNVPAGNYLIWGKVVLEQTNGSSGFPKCQLKAEGEFDEVTTGIGGNDDSQLDFMRGVSMILTHFFAFDGKITIRCVDWPGTTMKVSHRKIHALQVGNLTNTPADGP